MSQWVTENAKYLLEKNANQEFKWFSRIMVKELVEEDVKHIKNYVEIEVCDCKDEYEALDSNRPNRFE